MTKGQWRAVMGTQPWTAVPDSICPQALGDDPLQPACNVSRTDALQCAAQLATMTGLPFSLPSSATYQALLGGSPFPWGSATDVATVSPFASVR